MRASHGCVYITAIEWLALMLCVGTLTAAGQTTAPAEARMPNTEPLTDTRDFAAEMVTGIDRYFMRELAASVERRESHWKRDYSSAEAYVRSVEPNRKRFAKIIGVVDARLPATGLELVATTTRPARVATKTGYTVEAVRWPVFEGVEAEGLLLQPANRPVARIVALPDADWTPEMLAGIEPGKKSTPRTASRAFAKQFAESGCEVLVPVLIDRRDTWSGNPKVRMTNQPHREFIYRMAFEMGRHIIGYEVQKVLAAVDWFEKEDSTGGSPGKAREKTPITVVGYGEGGLIALYSAAVDTRIDAVHVSGYFQSRQDVWREPIYRNVWGLLDEFGDAEIASLIAPRPLMIEACRGPEVAGQPPARDGRSGAAPGTLFSPPTASVLAEFERAKIFYNKLDAGSKITLVMPIEGKDDEPGPKPSVRDLLDAVGSRRPNKQTPPKEAGKVAIAVNPRPPANRPARQEDEPDLPPLDSAAAARTHRQFDQLVEYTQKLVRDSHHRRSEFWAKADASSVEKWQTSCDYYRDYFWNEIIGRCEPANVPANPRTRRIYDQPKWTAYEVMLDVWPDVYAYGILLVPKDLKSGERRPVVVCQHGLEGRPQETCDPVTSSPYYRGFGGKLADLGFVVYAPQNPYIGKDLFRVLQRKANPLKWSLFSVIVRQHERTLEWLSGQSFVDPQRIAFYGLSYGGKTAMRVPALLPQYCLSICSGDFNEWIVKNTSLDLPVSYMFTHEYEMPEFDLGNTYNYAEMANLITPRPFMVERGHHDSVGTDEMVSWEYAKVRRRYVQLGIGDRTTIEYFNGPHEIHGVGTFEFLSRHLNWPAH